MNDKKDDEPIVPADVIAKWHVFRAECYRLMNDDEQDPHLTTAQCEQLALHKVLES